MNDKTPPVSENWETTAESEKLINFLELAASQLVSCGCSSNRIERLFSAIANQYNCELDIVATPTSVQMLLRNNGQRLYELSRIRDWSVDLSRLDQISLIIKDLTEQKINLDTAFFELQELKKATSIYPDWLTTIAVGGSSAVLAKLYGAGLDEAMIVFLIAACSNTLSSYLAKQDHGRYLSDFFAALMVACCSKIIGYFIEPIDEFRMIVSGIVALLPGLVFLNAVHELAQKNLVSGAAKIFETAIVSLSLSFGVASGISLALLIIDLLPNNF